VLACLGGLLWWLAMRILARGREHDPRIPFGAPLCAAVWITWLYGPLQVGG
jgi:prepilin signal peptidase PulO-like enzyme (type II secretory pathway)